MFNFNRIPALALVSSLIIAIMFLIVARSIYSHPVLQAISENLCADAIVIGLSLTFIDQWSKRQDHASYDESEQLAIKDVQTRIYLCVSVAQLILDPDALRSNPEIDLPKNAEWQDIMYLKSLNVLKNFDYSKVTDLQVKDVLEQKQKAADDIKSTISLYQGTLTNKSHSALLNILRRIDTSSSPGLSLMMIDFRPRTALLGDLITEGQLAGLKLHINGLLEIGELASDLDEFKKR